MTEPSGNYASDRHLLLQEVKLLGTEVSRLRGDTKHLNDVIVPREEHARRRRVYGSLAGLSLLLFFLAACGLYIQNKKIGDATHDYQVSTYNLCVTRNNTLHASEQAGIEINQLLITLRDSESQIAQAKGVGPLAPLFEKRTQAYDRYLAFVATQAPAPGTPVSSCNSLKPRS